MCNASGSDEAKCEVRVLTRPGAPQGLQVTVEGSKCALLWKKSKDDGGAAIEHYQVNDDRIIEANNILVININRTLN